MHLTDEERRILDGASGEPQRIAFSALLAEALSNVQIPIVDGLNGNSRAVLRTGDRVRVDGTKGAIEVVSRG